MRVKKLPMILALHLKRFKYMEQLHRYTKLSYRVVFPLELRLFNTSGDAVNLDRMYDLVAVVVHCGRYSILIIIHIAKVRVMDLVTPGKSRYVRLLLCHVLEFKKITLFIFLSLYQLTDQTLHFFSWPIKAVEREPRTMKQIQHCQDIFPYLASSAPTLAIRLSSYSKSFVSQPRLSQSASSEKDRDFRNCWKTLDPADILAQTFEGSSRNHDVIFWWINWSVGGDFMPVDRLLPA